MGGAPEWVQPPNLFEAGSDYLTGTVAMVLRMRETI